MADAKLTALTAASALAAADLFYVSQSAASRKATGTQLLALVGTAYVPLAGGTMTGALTLPAGAVGTPSLNFAGSPTTGIYSQAANHVSFAVSGANRGYFTSSMFWAADGGIGNLSNSGFFAIGSDYGVLLYRDAAGVLAQRNGTNAQTLRVYGTYTDSSNYERLSLSTTAGSSVNISAETLGTGGDNLDIVLTPAGSGRTKMSGGVTLTSGGLLLSGFGSGLDQYASGLRLGSGGEVAWCVGAGNTAVDSALLRGAAGQVDVTNGTASTYRDLKLRNLLQTAYHEVTEMTAPSAPATNSVRIYAEDNGSGKTRLMALFATGAAQQISIEP